MKKFLCAILTLCMLGSAFNFTLAENTETGKTARELLGVSYDLLLKVGILEENDLLLAGDQVISRAEFSVYLCRFAKIDLDLSGRAVFRDVMQGAKEEKSIYTAVLAGLMKSVKDDYFYPAYQITKEDAVYAMLMSLGYGNMLENVANPMVISGTNALFKGLAEGNTLNRVDVYKMLYNALFMPVMELNSIGGSGASYQINNGIDALHKFHDIDVLRGTITGAGSIELGKPNVVFPDNSIKINENYFEISEKLEAIDWLGRNVKCYYNYKETPNSVLFLEQVNNRIINTKDMQSLTYGNNEYSFYDNGRTVTYAFSTPYVVYNGSEYQGAYTDEIMRPDYGELQLLDNDSDGVIDLVFITEFQDYFVKFADAQNNFFSDYLINSPNFEDSDQIEVYNSGGKLDSFSSIQEKNVITVMPNSQRGFYRIYVSRDTLEGFVSEIKTEGNEALWKIADNEFSLSPYLINALRNNLLADVIIGETYIFYLNMHNKIVYFEKPQSTFIKDKSYGILVKAAKSQGDLSDDFEMRIFSKLAGDFANYEVADRIRLNGQSGTRRSDVYKALCRDGMVGIQGKEIVPQVIEFSVDADNQINYIQQVGEENVSKPMLHLFTGNTETNGYTIPYRDVIVGYSPNGRTTFDNKPANIAGVNFASTEALRVPFRDGKIAVDREDLFSISAVPSNLNFKFFAYKKDPRDSMVDFVMILEDADTPVNCGIGLSPVQIQRISQVLRDDETVVRIKTEKRDYYLDSRFDVNKLKIYNTEGNETGETYELQIGDIVNILADANDNVTAIEPVYNSAENKFVWQSGSTFYSRDRKWNMQILNLYKVEGIHWLMTPNDPETFDEVYDDFYLSKIRPETYYYDRKNQTFQRAVREHYVGYKDSSTEYVIAVVFSNYYNPRTIYVMKNIKGEDG